MRWSQRWLGNNNSFYWEVQGGMPANCLFWARLRHLLKEPSRFYVESNLGTFDVPAATVKEAQEWALKELARRIRSLADHWREVRG
jgi:hypothetical protein